MDHLQWSYMNSQDFMLWLPSPNAVLLARSKIHYTDVDHQKKIPVYFLFLCLCSIKLTLNVWTIRIYLRGTLKGANVHKNNNVLIQFLIVFLATNCAVKKLWKKKTNFQDISKSSFNGLFWLKNSFNVTFKCWLKKFKITR